MLKIKSFKLFLEALNARIGKANFTNRRDESILSQIELYKVSNNIYSVVIVDPRLRTHLFMRYAEFYETPNEDFRNKKFSVDEYINWYKKERDSELFSYQFDWAGFNIPSTSIRRCIDQIEDPNDYDIIMKNIFDTTIENNNGRDFYLLGADSIDLDDETFRHEISHGLYTTNKTYKTKMDRLTKNLPERIYKQLKAAILEMGYTDGVVDDEIQAYMSTGLGDMSKIYGISKWIHVYQNALSEHFRVNVKPIKLDIKLLK